MIELGQPRFEAGYWQGMRQPAFVVPVRQTQTGITVQALHRFDALRLRRFQIDASSPVLPADIAAHPVLGRVVGLTLEILMAIGMPVMSGVRAVAMGSPSDRPWQLGLPAMAPAITAPVTAVALACKLMNVLAGGAQIQAASFEAQLKQLIDHYQPLAPRGVNSLRFLQAAHQLNIPWRHVANNVYQFGWGRRSRWLDSSFTDETSTISASLARDKMACAQVLRDAGLPVPRHQRVSSAEQAVKVAEALSYPVVVKPADLDGGRGVTAGVRDAQGVKNAFYAARSLSARVLIEQFVAGQDYRLQVFKGEVYWVVRRSPAGVLGDGVSTVKELVARTNAARDLRASSPTADPMQTQGYAPITLDEESLVWLAAQGLHPQAVPADGQAVRLRGAANVAQGGTREGVPLDQVHPDNVALVVRAVSALRLDLAGVDFLTPDIARSWKEVGGGICEVNAQPQMSEHLHVQLLPKLLPQGGRIPVIGAFELPALRREIATVKRTLAATGRQLAWVESAAACRQALADPAVDAVVWQCDQRQTLAAWPVDTLDLLLLPAGMAVHRRSQPMADDLARCGQVWQVGAPAEAGAEVTLDALPQKIARHLQEHLNPAWGRKYETR